MVALGCSAAACEVRCPIARHRVDAAGYWDPLPRTSARGIPADRHTPHASLTRGSSPRTVIVECKQSRADFVRDGPRLHALIQRRDHLHAVRRALEDRILKVCEPELRRSGTALFPELEEWNFAESRVESYRTIVRELALLDRRIHGSSKFFLLAHYRLADALLIAAPTGMLAPADVPRGWGLVEVDRAAAATASADQWTLRVPPPDLTGRLLHRRRLLRNIAAALTRRALGPSLPILSIAAEPRPEPAKQPTANPAV